MTVFLEAKFDAATSGTITTVNEPGISSIANTAPSFSGADARYGAAAALIPVGIPSLMNQILPTPATSLYWRVYFKMTGLNTAQAPIIGARDGANNNAASITVNASQSIVLRDGNVNAAVANHVLSLGEWVRLEWYVDRGGGTQTLECYYGANAEGPAPDERLTATCTAATSPLYRVAFGMIGTVAGAQFAYDEAVLADTYVGAYVPNTYAVTVWDGTSEAATSSVTVWDGSAEVAASLLGTKA